LLTGHLGYIGTVLKATLRKAGYDVVFITALEAPAARQTLRPDSNKECWR